MATGVDVLAAFNIAKDAFSVASLTLPYIFLSTGLPLAAASVLVLGLASWAGAVFLHRAAEDAQTKISGSSASSASLLAADRLVDAPPVSYSHCVELLWGRRAKMAADVTIVVVDTSASFAMLIAAGQALHSVGAIAASHAFLAHYPPLVIAVGLVVAAVCVALPSGDALKYPSALGATAFLALLVLTGVLGARGELHQADLPPPPPRSHVWSSLGWPNSLRAAVLAPGVLKFCFAGIESWPSLAVPLGQAYIPTLALATAIMMSFTMAMGLVGYAYAPADVAENLLLDLPDSVAGNSARIATAAMLAFTTPILLFAAFEILEFATAAAFPSLAARPSPAGPPASLTASPSDPLLPSINTVLSQSPQSPQSPPTASRPAATAIRLLLVIIASVAAASFPNLVYAVSVTGAVGDSALGLVIPGIAACGHRSPIAGIALVIIGLVCMICAAHFSGDRAAFKTSIERAGAASVTRLTVAPSSSDGEVEYAASLVSSIVELDLARCSYVTDASISAVAASCPALTSVNLYCCERVGDEGVAALSHGCPQLATINLRGCPSITAAALAALADGRGRMLRELNVHGCHLAVTDDALAHIAASCPSLCKLDISGCKYVTDVALRALAAGCSQLTSVVAARCRELTDTGAIAVAAGSPNLRTLDLAGCRKTGSVRSATSARRAYLEWMANTPPTEWDSLYVGHANAALCNLAALGGLTPATVRAALAEGIALPPELPQVIADSMPHASALAATVHDLLGAAASRPESQPPAYSLDPPDVADVPDDEIEPDESPFGASSPPAYVSPPQPAPPLLPSNSGSTPTAARICAAPSCGAGVELGRTCSAVCRARYAAAKCALCAALITPAEGYVLGCSAPCDAEAFFLAASPPSTATLRPIATTSPLGAFVLSTIVASWSRTSSFDRSRLRSLHLVLPSTAQAAAFASARSRHAALRWAFYPLRAVCTPSAPAVLPCGTAECSLCNTAVAGFAPDYTGDISLTTVASHAAFSAASSSSSAPASSATASPSSLWFALAAVAGGHSAADTVSVTATDAARPVVFVELAITSW
ncbi:uncharacterized protein AMSG_12290 [Thecamonas trahens ATCC 50062]|uniref:Uncharacterized protein n=1 Tax=Thecamonas trahens ATCC 50062 TaxID=461836 RepID=A0A0L0DNF7_THETB|nr:hypothetical protein AMSG_12290 [Thecamonas trahens ATCC 50062]KNC53847.1 hypothetical protein AMSG_12290 [Thecamonas trahens ATCC 50062]|eukprot:XP_013754283.1 hypothetical protein AMSG_12290 [Thecamonas trahens ATCC 50062]